MSRINEEIGLLLREAREKSGLSLRDVASKVGKSYSSIHSYETGRQGINVDVLEILCDIYGVSYLDLLSKVYYTMKLKKK